MAEVGRPFFNQGDNTFTVPMELHAQNRMKLCDKVRKGILEIEKVVIVLRGGESLNKYDTDTELLFRQESYFQWAFGVKEPDCWGIIEPSSGNSTLFFPFKDENYRVWCGIPKELDYFKAHYGVESVKYTRDFYDILTNMQPELILTMSGVNTDSKTEFDEPILTEDFRSLVDNTLLYPIISECRVFKSQLELDVMRYSNKIASEAHKEVMRRIRPGMMEYQLEAIFQHYCYYFSGSRNSYQCICASGPNGAILHYGHAGEPNSKLINDGDMCVFDMGCEYHCYCSDITCSFPANGKFTKKQKIIYEAVLKSSTTVKASMKPGVNWMDMHRMADRIHLEALKEAGILKGNIDDMQKACVGAVFMPHGLGHFIGLDVHDVGGYTKSTPKRSKEPGLCCLRTSRDLEEGMVITLEPGIYFNAYLIGKAVKSPYHSQFFTDKIEEFLDFGGVRIEDDILITKEGIECLTQVPRTVEEIEALMGEGSKTASPLSFPPPPPPSKPENN